MQLGLEFVPASIVAADDQLFIKAFFESSAQVLGHVFEMVQGFVVDAALGVAAVVSGVTVAASLTSRRRAKHPFTLFQFIQAKIEETGLLAIHERDPQTRLRTQ